MRNVAIKLVIGLTLALGITAPPTRIAAAAGEKAPKAKKPNMQRVAEHLRQHVKYPATRQQILDACADTEEFSPAEKTWSAAHLPEGTYASADEVLKALGK